MLQEGFGLQRTFKGLGCYEVSGVGVSNVWDCLRHRWYLMALGSGVI